MNDKKPSNDAVQWAYNRYIKNSPERVAHLDIIRRQSVLARKVYDIRNKLRMTREDLAEFSGLTPEIIEDVEESDYDGDWDEAIRKINVAFRMWISDVIIPIAKMPADDYSVSAETA